MSNIIDATALFAERLDLASRAAARRQVVALARAAILPALTPKDAELLG